MITLQHVYWAAGAVFALYALLSVRDASNPRRYGTALFWALLAASFLVGERIGDLANGILVVVLALLAGLGALGRGVPASTTVEARSQLARRRGNWIFLPALIVPAVTFALAWKLKDLKIDGRALLGSAQTTVISLALGIGVALLIAMVWLRARPSTPIQEGRRLIDSVGWATILPQALAALGGVFAAAGVGKAVGRLIAPVIPIDSAFLVVAAYTCGMALFTVVMGNAFAAFPIMTAAIGFPLIVAHLHGDPVIMAAIGMLSGFCGTLMTPMAANFNVVPAMLLELPDRNAIFNGVIRAQAPTGALLLVFNTVLMYALVFSR